MADPSKERIARNENAFRALNESLGDVHAKIRRGGDKSGFVCECADPACAVFVSVDLHRYEQIRQDPCLFLVAPGHEIPDAEDVVSDDEGFLVVRKHAEVADIVRGGDPRR